jgi:hypothetical protein
MQVSLRIARLFNSGIFMLGTRLSDVLGGASPQTPRDRPTRVTDYRRVGIEGNHHVKTLYKYDPYSYLFHCNIRVILFLFSSNSLRSWTTWQYQFLVWLSVAMISWRWMKWPSCAWNGRIFGGNHIRCNTTSRGGLVRGDNARIMWNGRSDAWRKEAFCR